MSAMHEKIQPVTAKDIAKRERKTVRTIQARFAKLYPGETFNCNALLSPELVAALSRNSETPATQKAVKVVREKPAKPVAEIPQHEPDEINETDIIQTPDMAPATVHQPAPETKAMPPAPARAKFKWPTFGLSEFLALVIYGHTGLVWYELADIFVTPGIFAGVILAAMKHAAVVVTRSGKYPQAVHHAVSVAFLLDLLAWYVHYRSFFNALRVSHYMDDMGQDSYTVAKVLAGVLCAGAFASLFLIYKLKYNAK